MYIAYTYICTCIYIYIYIHTCSSRGGVDRVDGDTLCTQHSKLVVSGQRNVQHSLCFNEGALRCEEVLDAAKPPVDGRSGSLFGLQGGGGRGRARIIDTIIFDIHMYSIYSFERSGDWGRRSLSGVSGDRQDVIYTF